jgi:hypothetical protein
VIKITTQKVQVFDESVYVVILFFSIKDFKSGGFKIIFFFSFEFQSEVLFKSFTLKSQTLTFSQLAKKKNIFYVSINVPFISFFFFSSGALYVILSRALKQKKNCFIDVVNKVSRFVMQ